ncbi:MAG: glycosyltransferase [Pseudomonadota bacterium]
MIFIWVLFFISFFILLYGYIGYPLLLVIWAELCRAKAKDFRYKLKLAENLPKVSLILVCSDQRSFLPRFFEAMQHINYPKNSLEIIVVADGIDDGSLEWLKAQKNPLIKMLEQNPSRGKAAALSRAVEKSSGEILIFSNVRHQMGAQSINYLVERLQLPTIGVVIGLISNKSAFESWHEATNKASLGERYERHIKLWESQIHSMSDMSSGLYAIRRRDYLPLAEDTIFHEMEMALPMLYQSRRIVMEPRAQVFPQTPITSEQKIIARKKFFAGNLQSISKHSWLLSPRQNPIWIQFFSYPILRLIMPYAMLVLFITSLALPHPLTHGLFIVQFIFYGIAWVAYSLPTLRQYRWLFNIYFFVALHKAAITGVSYWKKPF